MQNGKGNIHQDVVQGQGVATNIVSNLTTTAPAGVVWKQTVDSGNLTNVMSGVNAITAQLLQQTNQDGVCTNTLTSVQQVPVPGTTGPMTNVIDIMQKSSTNPNASVIAGISNSSCRGCANTSQSVVHIVDQNSNLSALNVTGSVFNHPGKNPDQHTTMAMGAIMNASASTLTATSGTCIMAGTGSNTNLNASQVATAFGKAALMYMEKSNNTVSGAKVSALKGMGMMTETGSIVSASATAIASSGDAVGGFGAVSTSNQMFLARNSTAGAGVQIATVPSAFAKA